jgi:hypothetical protein
MNYVVPKGKMAVNGEMREIWKESMENLRKAMHVFYEVRLCSFRESMPGPHSAMTVPFPVHSITPKAV